MATIGVCGFGRCGSTMVMAMLAAGGIPAVEGSDPVSGELPDLDHIAEADLDGRSIKLLDLALRAPLPPSDWRFVWLDRDRVEQTRSVLKLLAAAGQIDLTKASTQIQARRLYESFGRDRPRALARLRAVGPLEVVQYERILANPTKAAKQLRRLALDLEVRAAAAVVHDRDPACRPDLSFELAQTTT